MAYSYRFPLLALLSQLSLLWREPRQKPGGGCSSLVDINDKDWIDYHSRGNSVENFRGIPNLVYPEEYFHPGATSSTTTVVSQGPLKVKVHSITNDNKWETSWEIYPNYATMTVLAIDHNYWFLYEGTPGGSLEIDSDFVVRADGTQTLTAASWDGDLVDEGWVYFGDPNLGRSLFLAHHEDDDAFDSYRHLDGNMTVLGFGRQTLASRMNLVPAHFGRPYILCIVRTRRHLFKFGPGPLSQNCLQALYARYQFA
jgi:hypothetical protein